MTLTTLSIYYCRVLANCRNRIALRLSDLHLLSVYKQRPPLTRAGSTPFPTMLLPHQPGSKAFIDNMAVELGLDLEKTVI